MNAKLVLAGIGIVGVGSVSIYAGISSKSPSLSDSKEEDKNKEPTAYVLSSEKAKNVHGTDINDSNKLANITASNWSSLHGNSLDMKDALVADIPENEEWWKWNYKAFSDIKPKNSDAISTEFQAINSDYSSENTNTTSLNKACAAAYSKNKTEFMYTTDGGGTLDSKDNKYKYFRNVWNFCRKSAKTDNYE